MQKIQNASLGYYNGTIKPLNELLIPVTDRAVYFGDGVYEVVFAVNNKPFAIDEHIERFFNSCKLLNINFTKSANELKNIILNLLNQTAGNYHKIYWQVSRGSAIRNHSFNKELTPNLLIMITPEKLTDMNKIEYDLISVEDTRFLHCNIKTLNLIPSVLASQKAKENKAQEAVLFRNGFVTECAHSNISILKGNTLQTAPANNLILPGVTRKHLIEICSKLNLKIVEQPFTLNQLKNCDEAIVSASGILFVRAKSIDSKKIGGKNKTIIKQIQKAYENKIIKECGALLY